MDDDLMSSGWKTVLIAGAGGAVGRAVLDVLLAKKNASRIVLTSRSGLQGLPESSDECSIEVKALDLIDGAKGDLSDLCKDVTPDVMFCCIGILRYHAKAWGPGWPKIVERLLLACKETDVPLVFMDNLYSFGPEGMSRMPLREQDSQFTESGTKSKPQVRALIERQLLAASAAGEARLALVRASDFYGPRVRASALNLAWTQIIAGKKPPILGDPSTVHAETFVPDIARALVLVAENPDTWGRAWHVPPTQPQRATSEWVKDIYALNGKPIKDGEKVPMMGLSDGMLLSFLSLFSERIDGLKDTMYMWKGEYTVSAEDFEARFPDFKPTPLDESMTATQESLQGSKQ